MPDDVQWIERLAEKIRKQKAYQAEYDERYKGTRILKMVADEYREVYGNEVDGNPRLQPPRAGVAAIGVDALIDRLNIDGFEMAPAPSGGPSADAARLLAAAQAAWDDSDLDAMHTVAMREGLICARSFGLVWPGQDGRAVISIESADEMAVHRQSAPPYDVDVALKLTKDEWTGRQLAKLWRDGYRTDYLFSDIPRTYLRADGQVVATNWEPMGYPLRSPFGDVSPVVELAHWTRLRDEPISAIEPVASLVDEADLIEALKVFAGHFGAVPIRWATGLPVPRDPADPTGQTPLLDPRTGRPFLGFNPRADHLWTSTNKDTKFGTFTPATLEGFIAWDEATSNKIRAKSAVPEFYYGTKSASHITGETLKVNEAPMMRRVGAVCKSFTHGFRRITMLALSLDVPGVQARSRLVIPHWTNPETRVEAAATDSFQKQVSEGVPIQIAMRETLGWSRDVIDEAMGLIEAKQQADAAALSAANADTGAGGDTVPALPVVA